MPLNHSELLDKPLRIQGTFGRLWDLKNNSEQYTQQLGDWMNHRHMQHTNNQMIKIKGSFLMSHADNKIAFCVLRNGCYYVNSPRNRAKKLVVSIPYHQHAEKNMWKQGFAVKGMSEHIINK